MPSCPAPTPSRSRSSRRTQNDLHHHLRGLESHAARQGHGHRATTCTCRPAARSRSAIRRWSPKSTALSIRPTSPLFADLKNAPARRHRRHAPRDHRQYRRSRSRSRLAAGESRRIAHRSSRPSRSSTFHDPQALVALRPRPAESPPPAPRVRNRRQPSPTAQDVQFGIREVTSELDAQQHRLFRINGRRILIRGGGWTHDMLLRVDDRARRGRNRSTPATCTSTPSGSKAS